MTQPSAIKGTAPAIAATAAVASFPSEAEIAFTAAAKDRAAAAAALSAAAAAFFAATAAFSEAFAAA